MSTKFFNNNAGNTLFEKIAASVEAMPLLHQFLAVVGYFRATGYFKLRRELDSVQKIRVLVGINVDEVTQRYGHAHLLDPQRDALVWEAYRRHYLADLTQAEYTAEIEAGVRQMVGDIAEGRLELRIHPSRNLHAKFYLLLPEQYDSPEHDGRVIMGSSNISDAGLGIKPGQRYELNVMMRDFDDVRYCYDEFLRLWKEGQPIPLEELQAINRETYIGNAPTPYEIYMKVLINVFGDLVEDDFTTALPEGVKDLKYQRDAVAQGYRMLLQYNGLFLSDVVGLGKTLIATMIAQRFIQANGARTRILVVFPPAVEQNWRETFRLFGMERAAHFLSCGSLNKVLEQKDQYRAAGEYDLVIVDESHGFRSDNADKYEKLQKICKAQRTMPGHIGGTQKKVMLLSATPLNNRPEDLRNQLLLFQDGNHSTLDGIPSLDAFFAPLNQRYKRLQSERDQRDITKEVEKLYNEIRERVIAQVTVRRTRNNILHSEEYRADLEQQHITFPVITPPREVEYQMAEATSKRFYQTISCLSDESADEHVTYARYRALEFLKPDKRARYDNAEQVSKTLAGIYRVHMVKRLESSFYAFRCSLQNLLRYTNDILRMVQENKIIIARELNIGKQLSDGASLDDVLAKAEAKGYKAEEVLYTRDDFDPVFFEMLRRDREIVSRLCREWDEEKGDAKFDAFAKLLHTDLLQPELNPAGKLVVFSESVDTLKYLKEQLVNTLGRTDVLFIDAQNRDAHRSLIRQCFDANCAEPSNRYNILLTSDVLAEGVNLHRANVIVNYDQPWNATRLMQRIGRVNRIGSAAKEIYNYVFYPSKQGNTEIRLRQNALIKLQSFHTAFGEDAQIYSREEIVKEFKLFDSDVTDETDRRQALLDEVRKLYTTNRALYSKIKALPERSRAMRQAKGKEQKDCTIAYVSSPVKTEFYRVRQATAAEAAATFTLQRVEPIGLLEAVKYLAATPAEQAVKEPSALHYDHVKAALSSYRTVHQAATDTMIVAKASDNAIVRKARAALRHWRQNVGGDEFMRQCDALDALIARGTYTALKREVNVLAKQYGLVGINLQTAADDLRARVQALCASYPSVTPKAPAARIAHQLPKVVISETFV